MGAKPTWPWKLPAEAGAHKRVAEERTEVGCDQAGVMLGINGTSGNDGVAVLPELKLKGRMERVLRWSGDHAIHEPSARDLGVQACRPFPGHALRQRERADGPLQGWHGDGESQLPALDCA
jgi:hypothetical protein